MPQQVYEVTARTTRQLEWVNSGVTPSAISCALIDRNETLVSSVAAVSSGNGHYYALVTHPGSGCWVVNEWIAVINANTYVSRQFGHVITQEVD
jgi:hypothetical protein